jgi:hypothetical protein
MPNGQFPPILAGTTLTAALFAEMEPIYAWKAGDTGRSLTTTVADDPDLQITVPAAGTYEFSGYLNYEGNTGGSSDMKFAMSSVGTLRYHITYQGSGGSANVGDTKSGGTTFGMRTQGAGTLCGASILGMLTTGSTGVIKVQWAQNTSDAVQTIMHANSFIKLLRVA